MAKTLQIIASSGQSVPTDAVAGQTLTLTGGTVTLVNDGTYGYLWRLVGGYLENQTLTGQGNYGEPSAPKTVAFRFRVSNRQAAFTRWAIYGSGASDGVVIGNNSVGGTSAGALRSGAMAGGSMVSGLSTIAKTYTADTVLTVVLRANFGASDLIDLWYQTTGRVGTTADAAVSGAFAFGSAVCDTLRLTAASGETLDILDFVAWDTLLTDAQCAQAADDIRAFLSTSPATAVTLTGPTSGAVGVASTNFTVGANCSITGTVIVTPSDDGGGGTFTPTSVSISDATPAATFTYTPGSTGAKTVSVTNNGGLTNPGSITYTASAAAATAITMTGPSGGQVGVASADFTIGANGTISGSHTVTPSDGGAGGTFTPTSVTISSGTPTATFTYTPASAGAKTISATDAGGYTAPSSLTYTATTAAGTLTSSALKNNKGTVLAGVPFEAYVSSPTTGVLVVKKAGLTSNGSGVVSFSDGTLAAATSYRVVWRRTDTGAEGLETLTAT